MRCKPWSSTPVVMAMEFAASQEALVQTSLTKIKSLISHLKKFRSGEVKIFKARDTGTNRTRSRTEV